ncbi:MAG TPA: nitrate ABC transporter substrate-binding protein, partial [Burkholderiales bacterium]|nr:nitrate ABC transporter substrate-binding protein [Burkholderiales bacterium]
AAKKENRLEIAKAISLKNYLNQPEEVVAAVLTGQYDDGLGNKRNVPDRIDFNPFPWHSMGVWILTQMKRWGYIKGEVNYKQIAEQVYRAADCGKIMKELGYTPPASTYAKYTIMGKVFDPAQPEAYVKSFKISKA